MTTLLSKTGRGPEPEVIPFGAFLIDIFSPKKAKKTKKPSVSVAKVGARRVRRSRKKS